MVVLEENEALQQQLAEKEAMRKAQEEKIDRLEQLICVSSQIKPTTPDVKTFAARKRRRETWCPGKGGLLRPPKIPEYSGGLDVSFPARKVPKSLPNLEEISGTYENALNTVFVHFSCYGKKTCWKNYLITVITALEPIKILANCQNFDLFNLSRVAE